jgi:cobaltochelatase CobT
MAADSPLERFRNVLGGAARALSGEREAELSFTGEAPRQDGRQIKVPTPSRTLPRRGSGRGARLCRQLRAAPAPP